MTSGDFGYNKGYDDRLRVLEFAESHKMYLVSSCLGKPMEYSTSFRTGPDR